MRFVLDEERQVADSDLLFALLELDGVLLRVLRGQVVDHSGVLIVLPTTQVNAHFIGPVVEPLGRVYFRKISPSGTRPEEVIAI